MNWYKIAQQNTLQLPAIPNGYVRLTHFTSINNAISILSSGLKFLMLGQTTDTFRNNSEIMNLISTGEYGGMQRGFIDGKTGGFGDAVVLIDLTYQEQKSLYGTNTTNDIIPPYRIIGYIYKNQFKSNPTYNPSINLQVNSYPAGIRFKPQNKDIAIPSPTNFQNNNNSHNEDIW